MTMGQGVRVTQIVCADCTTRYSFRRTGEISIGAVPLKQRLGFGGELRFENGPQHEGMRQQNLNWCPRIILPVAQV